LCRRGKLATSAAEWEIDVVVWIIAVDATMGESKFARSRRMFRYGEKSREKVNRGKM
jgi:hypothetical protein